MKSIAKREHEVALYIWKGSTVACEAYEKRFNFSLRGMLQKEDILDLAVQTNIEVIRRKQFGGGIELSEAQRRVSMLIESGRVLSGLVRVAEKTTQGKLARDKSSIATVNILGIIGMVILTLRAALTVLVPSIYRRGAVADVESSYRRAVEEIHGEEWLLGVPDRAPSIAATIDDNHWINFPTLLLR